MVDVSNRTLATLLVAAIVISLGGTLISLDRLGGLAPLTGQATLDTADIPAPSIDVMDNIDTETDGGNESEDDVNDGAMD